MLIDPHPTIDNLGGKGYQLSLLRQICPVPDFFVIRFDSKNELDDITIQNQILTAFDEHSFTLVSVRSSATLEDSSIASFAGMFESKLNVKRDELIQAIKDILQSLKSKRVIEYCSINGLQCDSIEMRVVVQKMINSRVSGVCITKDKIGSTTLLIEACLGLGEALVSGAITPDTYKVDRDKFNLISFTIGFQKMMLSTQDKGGLVAVPFFQRNAKKLLDKEIFEMSKLFIFIENKLGFESADIEWTYENSSLFVLQVRPFVGLN